MKHFSTTNEEPDNSVSVTFEPVAIQPPLRSVVSCALFTAQEGRYLLAKQPAGWDLPRLIRLDNEEPEACVYRIAQTIGIDITEPQFIGQWVLEKQFDSPLNEALPSTSYQLLFIANVAHEGEFNPTPELTERRFIADSELGSLHHNYDNFKDIFEYARERFNRVP